MTREANATSPKGFKSWAASVNSAWAQFGTRVLGTVSSKSSGTEFRGQGALGTGVLGTGVLGTVGLLKNSRGGRSWVITESIWPVL